MVKKKNAEKMNRVLKSTPLKVYRIARDNKIILLKCVGLDLLFLTAFIIMNLAFTNLVPQPNDMPFNVRGKLLISSLMLIGYIALTFLIYSFFKFLIMYHIKNIFTKSKLDFGRFKRFYYANAALIVVFILIFLLFAAGFIFTIKVDMIKIVRDVFLVIFAVVMYISMNTMHALFMQNDLRIGRLLGRTSDTIFNNLHHYLSIIVSTSVMAAVFAGVYYMFDWSVLHILGPAMQAFPVYYGYGVVSIIVTVVLAFGLLSFNRVYFYKLVSDLNSWTGRK
ncbi:MAG: hypothetical protein V1729_01875 [Candidatus Woesearchaeota archaeon]